jgi:FMN phosphatase YigB (HAD superfamily)
MAHIKESVLVFDVDGVLGDFDVLRKKRDVAHITAVSRLKGLSYPETEQLFFQTKGKLTSQGKPSTIDTMQELGISKPEFFTIMNSVPVEGGIVITPHAKAVLEELSKKHHIVALTNTPYDSNVATLRYLGLLDFIDKIYSIDKYNFIKPSSSMFEKILEDFGVTQGYSIGDSAEKDLLPAKKAGLKTVLFGEGDADFVVNDLRELLDVFG